MFDLNKYYDNRILLFKVWVLVRHGFSQLQSTVVKIFIVSGSKRETTFCFKILKNLLF